MALTDIVVDSNVFVHCSGEPGASQCDMSVSFVTALVACETVCRIDEGFSVNEAKNRSLIGAEYLAVIHAGTLGYQVLFRLATTQRLVPHRVTPKADVRAAKRQIDQLIRKKRDRTFLLAAVMSDDRVLVTHDYEDFQVSKRETIRRQLDVAVVDADVAEAMLQP